MEKEIQELFNKASFKTFQDWYVLNAGHIEKYIAPNQMEWILKEFKEFTQMSS